jgi:ArsR family transcriptional regulator
MERPLSHPVESAVAPADLQALQILAEPNRARIVALLSHGEHCVCDVGSALRLSPALVSHHLRVLRTGGLLRERRDGRWMYYALDVERLSRLRAAVVALLTPTDAAATACACSDCGPVRVTAAVSGHAPRRSRLPVEVLP